MEPDFPKAFFNNVNLLPFLARLFAVKYQKISYFISFIHLSTITRMRPQSLKIQGVTFECFESLLSQDTFKTKFVGDIHSCALLSINTLIALSVRSKSWLKISKSSSQNGESDSSENDKNHWKITMPSVEENANNCDTNYYIQCYCVSYTPKDFVLYVTDTKLSNVSKHQTSPDSYSELIEEVLVKKADREIFPKIAQAVTISGIICANEITFKELEEVLDVYFLTPKFLKVHEVFQVNLKKYVVCANMRPNLCNLNDIYFRVNSITGNSENQDYYVIKGYTNIYLNSSGHGYLPQIDKRFVETNEEETGYEVPLCPTGLLRYYDKLICCFKHFLLTNENLVKPIFLLTGTKGIGKKTTLQNVATHFGLHLINIDCFDLYGSTPKLFEGKLDQIFSKVRRTVPCILHLENIELLGREQSHKENERLIDIFEHHITQVWLRKPERYPLIIVGSTHTDVLEVPSAIARLFTHTITFEVPKHEEMYKTLYWLTKNSNYICDMEDLKRVTEKITGYLFSELVLLVKHAIYFSTRDSRKDVNVRVLSLEHFKQGLAIMEANYSDSIGAAKVPTVHWDDVGGLEDIKEEIMLTLNLPLKHPELFASGLKRSGIMFYGPPGTGKTLMAKAIATECNYNFLSVKGPELMNMYVGQSEKNVREVFERARDASPCIIFFDELDSLAPARGKSGDSGGVTDRVVSQLLAEMDGLDKNKDVFVVAATNRPDLVDPALLRPGRFDKMFYVGVCKDGKSKLKVMKALTKRFLLDSGVDLEKSTEQLPNQVTGADIYSICSNAWFNAARRAVNDIEQGLEITPPLTVYAEDFTKAIEEFVPSLTEEDITYYDSLKSVVGN